MMQFPFAHSLFMRIAEPRVLRILQFFIYVGMTIAGVTFLSQPPTLFENIAGPILVHVFGAFIASGSILGAFAVLPGIWWLERVAILLLGTGLAMYIVFVVTLGSSIIGIVMSIAFLLTFVQRWTEIKGAQLAPRED